MAVLIKKEGTWNLLNRATLTDPTDCATCAVSTQGRRRPVSIANVHLSFPSQPDSVINDRRQACEVQKVARALSLTQDNIQTSLRLQVLGGDFNSNSRVVRRTICGSPTQFCQLCISHSRTSTLSYRWTSQSWYYSQTA